MERASRHHSVTAVVVDLSRVPASSADPGQCGYVVGQRAAAVGTSGEAARRQYGKLAGEHVPVSRKKPAKDGGRRIRRGKIGGTNVTFKVGGGKSVTKTSATKVERQHVPADVAARKIRDSDLGTGAETRRHVLLAVARPVPGAE